MGNVFDQFDEPKGGNVFDRFDESPSQRVAAGEVPQRQGSQRSEKVAKGIRQTTGSDEPGFGSRFVSHMGKEAWQGLSRMGEGVVSNLVSNVDPISGQPRSMGNRLFNLPRDVAGAGINAALGGLELSFAPSTALGKTVGESTVDTMIPHVGPNIAAGMATLADMGIGAATGALEAKLIGLASKGLLKTGLIPGSGAGMRQIGKEATEQFIGNVKGAGNSDKLFAQARVLNPNIDLAPIKQRMQELLDEAQLAEPSLRNPRIVKVLEDMKGLADQGNVPLKKVQANLTAVGEELKTLSRGAGAGEGATRQVYKSLIQAIEKSAGQPGEGGEVLKAALRQKRREHVSDDLEHMLRQATTPKEGTTVENVTFGQLLKKVKNKAAEDDLFAGSFDPGELEQLTKMLDQYRSVRVVEAGQGVITGSSAAVGRYGLGAAIGSQFGVNPWVAGAVTEMGSRIIARGLMSAPGRAMIANLIRDGQGFSLVKLAALATFVRGTTGDNLLPPSVLDDVAKAVKETLKDSNVTIEEKLRAVQKEQQMKDALGREPSPDFLKRHFDRQSPDNL